ncbi:transglutaminase family protein [Thiomicrorhabdus sp. 6S2-11]|uniref:Transglutaminase family protein n=1 Tax=Thiomicrorhabdus marina TaxID=2818442 RepID=A0ABS3Q2J2_9GAMM|nr:transglutaminase family protein [Thiomicrorhabdus marina]MBO1926548.1 transglutaminase family protein [Thiomicrorhabdus marina]
MALQVAISHKTKYKFDRKVSLSPHVFRLRPAPHSRTHIESYSLNISPKEHFINWQQDPFGNYLARVVFPEKVDELSVEVDLVADMKVLNPFDFFVEDSAEHFPFDYSKSLKKELSPYLETDEDDQELLDFVKTISTEEKKIVDFLVYINQKIYEHLSYNIRMEPGVQTCAHTLTCKTGSCRDYAWLFIQVLRHLGLAARFVSGYLVQLTADVESLDGPSGPAEDFTDLHAWTEVYIPGAGWIGLDATSGLFAGEGHIPLACTPHYDSASPIVGATDKCEVEFEFSNDVTRIFESPRITKPYRDEQWEEIYNLGFQVDQDLQDGDVRLTMGGEPTFVSIDDMESAEWNTDADGEHKRELADDLTRRLLNRFAHGGLIHQAQGKWYPGEPIPRWVMSLFWRKDGKAIWQNEKLLASNNKAYNYTTADAKNFMNVLCRYLGVSSQNVLPAYEDPIEYLSTEMKLPLDENAKEFDLKDDIARKKLAEVLSLGLDEEMGYILPLNWGRTKWITCGWEFKRGKLYLTPGNSPMGLRLPINSLLAKPHVELEESFEPDLFAPTGELGEFYEQVVLRGKEASENTTEVNSYSEFVRIGLCVEQRDGKIYIFMPPLDYPESFLDLIACVEATAAELNIEVVIEGYEPPKDNRIEVLRVTPDPGVIEVNVHPTNSWDELTTNTFALYEEARLSRLGTEKFMLDGKHTGTGGGNHVTIGGATPSDSPLLRDPNLLRSLITFWQHHPSLSYLFSGAFIGPTSQAPRVDEGRVENLYELEIAFSQIPDGEVPFWLTDRLFRHLLTDITGNTHRSEFCIDKLYSPDSSSGRLGILEFRGFDMPPHAQMSLLQMLLIRALIAVFWKKPYKHNLVRWGTQLHDKFLLEHYVKKDIADVVEFLNDNGYDFKLDWFDPFFEFRFPLYGMVTVGQMHVELRSAIEPWNVLGEEMGSGGTARYVDSSLERLQFKINDFNDARYVVTCNGVKVPLVATDKKGEFVCGVKYRAWQPWSALHPTIGVDTPLVFDVVDTWNSKSVGGCTYFVSHPGGLSYDVYPVNSYEAESRRINRFWDLSYYQNEHVPKALEEERAKELFLRGETKTSVERNESKHEFKYIELPPNNEFPHILDMRKKWRLN